MNRRIRRILALSGFDLSFGRFPAKSDAIGVWGQKPVARRGHWMARRFGAPVVTIEDPFLRSVRTGRDGDPPMGLVIDRRGIYFDASQSSDLEHSLETHDDLDAAQQARAKAAIERLKAADLSKYNIHDPSLAVPEPGYVLVIDQTRNDASIRGAGADQSTFRQMLAAAKAAHPTKPIVIKTHPEVAGGHRTGYFSAADEDDQVSLCVAPVSPWALLASAAAVYSVSSQLGFEAILAGHRPVIFGMPFYAGWGLSEDQATCARRTRALTPEQLFTGAMVDYPTWYDPFADALCNVETVCENLQVGARAYRDDAAYGVATGMRLWKRAHLNSFLGNAGRSPTYHDTPTSAVAAAKARGTGVVVWAGKETPALSDACAGDGVPLARMEDGFLRSTGLGASLVAPLSLVIDDLGIYYDPSRESRLERLIGHSEARTTAQIDRAATLIDKIASSGVTKYNTGAPLALPAAASKKRVILVPGQVEDDASIRLGTTKIATNTALLTETRHRNRDAFIIYKPHPDVEAGLRIGQVSRVDLDSCADHVAHDTSAADAIVVADEVWTMTSLLGFEALIRGKPVTCLGTPFFSGWGLTTDHGEPVPRRKAKPSIEALVHATLIAYPRYHDPKSNQPATPETIIERLAVGDQPSAGVAYRLLSKLQGVFASYAHIWR